MKICAETAEGFNFIQELIKLLGEEFCKQFDRAEAACICTEFIKERTWSLNQSAFRIPKDVVMCGFVINENVNYEKDTGKDQENKMVEVKKYKITIKCKIKVGENDNFTNISFIFKDVRSPECDVFVFCT